MKDRIVYRKPDDETFFEEELGEFLSISPVSNQASGIDSLVYYVEQDGSVGVSNRIDVLIKDRAKSYYPEFEDKVGEEIPLLDEEIP